MDKNLSGWDTVTNSKIETISSIVNDSILSFYNKHKTRLLQDNYFDTIQSDFVNSIPHPYIERDVETEPCTALQDIEDQTLYLLAMLPVIYFLTLLCFAYLWCRKRKTDQKVDISQTQLQDHSTISFPSNSSPQLELVNDERD